MTRSKLLLLLILFSSLAKSQSVQFAEVQGKKLFYKSKGTGNPAVVLVSGLGPVMDDFFDIQNSISNTTQVLCYDRPGIGNSEPLNNERDLSTISNELKALLDKVGLTKPVLLVGHSRGGVIVRYFVNKYPERVSGLILIDPAIPELKWKKRELRTEPEKKEYDAYYNSFAVDSSKYSPTIRNEFQQVYKSDSISAADKKFPTNIPVTIIASNKTTNDKYSVEETKIKVELLNGYLKSAPQLKLIFTDKSGHFIHDDEPELVIREIYSMLKAIKK